MGEENRIWERKIKITRKRKEEKLEKKKLSQEEEEEEKKKKKKKKWRFKMKRKKIPDEKKGDSSRRHQKKEKEEKIIKNGPNLQDLLFIKLSEVWDKARSMRHPMRTKLTNNGLLPYQANY